MAGASLAAAASIPPEAVIGQDTADIEGDRSLVKLIVDRKPELVAFSLYMWNAERSSWLASMLKKEIPGLITVAGGPEVTKDNEWLISSGAFDLMVSGEGEKIADTILNPASARDTVRNTGRFIDSGRMSFTPGTYPNPWLTGYLKLNRGASVYVETIRGCPGRCIYCSYRRSHPSPRIMDAASASVLLEKLVDAGAEEIVFLDPTFNSRGDLHELLRNMKGINSDFFGEMRGDLISPEIASLIADAGFRNVEIGLQSVNRNTLVRAGRPGDPVSVLDGALNLKKAGVTPVLDIMLGLPGDNPRDSVNAAIMIKDRNLHRHLQVFYLSVLPGTAMRGKFRNTFMSRPPYYRFCDKDMGGFAEAREEIADIAGYDLDLPGRPLLFEGWPGTELIELDLNPDLNRDMPSMRHGSLMIKSSNLWEERSLLLEFVRTRLNADPFCVLDVILCPVMEFPLNLIDMVSDLDHPVDYSGRIAEVFGRQGNLRVSVLIEHPEYFSNDWLASAAEISTVAVNADSPSKLKSELWYAGVSVRLPGNNWNLDELSAEVLTLQQVFFTDRQMEETWSNMMDI